MSNYSIESLAAEIEFDVEDYLPLLELFLDTTDSNLAKIINAAKISDKEGISSNVHNIKGASMNLCLNLITEIVEKMSELNKNGFFVDIEERVKECKIELNELRKISEKN